VLTTCLGDFTDRAHDEVLALSTALLAAGCASVVGSRWEVRELRTAIMMFMFHHFLAESVRAEGEPRVAEALREAQLWMLDEDRQAPPDMPDLLAAEVRRAARPEFRRELALADVASWAAFTVQGR
jgi:CHAT domain-containing protein